MKFYFHYDMKRSMAVFLRMIAMFLFLTMAGCRENKEFVDIVFDGELSYTMRDTEVQTFISDSGITRLKMETKEWLVFNEATEPYWFFPEKFYAEQFDTLLQLEASFNADTAYHYTKKKLWKFSGNVKAVNFEGNVFETSLMFWDQNEGKIYSDQFIRIIKGDFVNTGTGFESNQTLTKYWLYNAKAEIPVQENPPVDTTAVKLTMNHEQ